MIEDDLSVSDAEGSMSLINECRRSGQIDPDLIAAKFQTTKEDIAFAAGLPLDVINSPERVGTPDSQRSLREMLEVLNLVASRFDSPIAAYIWYRSEALSGFSGLTAAKLVAQGRVADVVEYLDAIDAGIYF